MGVSKQDIFGEGEGAQPATPDSYGVAPSGHRLPGTLRLGAVRLQVGDLARSLEYYQTTLGMRVLRQGVGYAALGAIAGDAALVELHERAGARPVPHRGRIGLYHFAILVPDRASLGTFVRHLSEVDARAGAADHLVSEAFYLQDPDNLGIEVYVDRPRNAWQRIGRQLMMATDPVDVAGLLRAAGGASWQGMPAGTVMGHVHLHVGAIPAASAFYSEALGFDRTVWQYPGALFMAAGGYHHHLGTNTWAGSGAMPPMEGEARLLEWTIELSDATSLEATAASLVRSGFSAEPLGSAGSGSGFVTRDPWGTQIRLRPAAAAAQDS